MVDMSDLGRSIGTVIGFVSGIVNATVLLLLGYSLLTASLALVGTAMLCWAIGAWIDRW